VVRSQRSSHSCRLTPDEERFIRAPSYGNSPIRGKREGTHIDQGPAQTHSLHTREATSNMDTLRTLSLVFLSVFASTPAFAQTTFNATNGSMVIHPGDGEGDFGVPFTVAGPDFSASGDISFVGPGDNPLDSPRPPGPSGALLITGDSASGFFDMSLTVHGIPWSSFRGRPTSAAPPGVGCDVIMCTTLDFLGGGTATLDVVPDPNLPGLLDISQASYTFKAPTSSTVSLLLLGLAALGCERRARTRQRRLQPRHSQPQPLSQSRSVVREKHVRKQTLATFGGSQRSRWVIVGMVFLGVLSVVPYRAHPQGQNEAAASTAVQSSALAGVVSSPLNPNQVAILHWYSANQTTSFRVGSSPQGVAYDGASVWVTNRLANTVTKLRASDGSVLGTFTIGLGPVGVAFDGSNIWTANTTGNNITKVRALDGVTLGFFAVGNFPIAVAFDGANIWAANFESATVSKVRASDGTTLGTFAVGSGPDGLAFDGANIWVANFNSANVTKLRASDGATLGTFTVGIRPTDVAFDGTNVWVVNEGNNSVNKLSVAGTILGTFAVGSVPIGVAFDGANIWVANSGSNTVTKLRTSSGANLGSFAVGSTPYAVAFDGANVWVANENGNTVTKL